MNGGGNARATPAPAVPVVEAAMKPLSLTNTPPVACPSGQCVGAMASTGLAQLLPTVSGLSLDERLTPHTVGGTPGRANTSERHPQGCCGGLANCFAVSESDVNPRLSVVVLRVFRSGLYDPTISVNHLAESGYYKSNKIALQVGPGVNHLANAHANQRPEVRGEQSPRLKIHPHYPLTDMLVT